MSVRSRSWLIGSVGMLVVLVGAVLVVGRGVAPEKPLTYPRIFPDDPFVTVTTTGLIADVDYLLEAIDEVHADPYRLVKKDAFRQKAEAIKESILATESPEIQLIDAYFLLQEVASVLEDEHTKIHYNEEWDQHWATIFPLELKIDSDRVLATCDSSAIALPEQIELLEINDRAVTNLIDQCRRVTNQTLPHYKRQIIEVNFGRWLQSYLKIPPPWRITFRHDGDEQTVEIDGLDAEAESQSTHEMYRETVMVVDGGGVPILEIPKFYYDDRSAYEVFMADFFTKHAGEPAIVIDLRENPGGDGRWAYSVLDFLTEEPYLLHQRFDFRISEPFVQTARFSFRRELWERDLPRLLWWLPRSIIGENRWMDRVEATDIGGYATEHMKYHRPDPEKPTYGGDVYLLVSHQSNSAAVVFATIFDYHDMGTTVGRETGGRTSFTSDSIPIALPNTQLFVWIPVAILELPGSTTGSGLVPDYVVEYTAEDLRNGHDEDLLKVRNLISERAESRWAPTPSVQRGQQKPS